MKRAPNRIRELRKAAWVSSEELGERVGTSGATIQRLEGGAAELTHTWMLKIASELGVLPADLLDNSLFQEQSDVALAADYPLAAALGSLELRIYHVLPEAKSVTGTGIRPGDVL
jgi:transcriptional regulator with XRE-family HTH domain